ncbi:MAG: sigma-54 dependent transcriptional regulator [Acidobacteriaceae bacterium]|nr:sigma-54 dependent transcriptional regulator [Acidobacteriaceae bacterium]
MPVLTRARVMIAAHTRGLAESLANVLTPVGYDLIPFDEPTPADLARELPRTVAEEKPNLILLELKKDADVLAHFRAHNKRTPVLVMLTSARPETAFLASRLGAEDLLLMSNSDEEIIDAVARILVRLRHEENAPSQSDPAAEAPSLASGSPDTALGPRDHALFGRHPHMAEIRETIAKVATTAATVLIRGESGVGKEIVARMIFTRSPRAQKPFVKVNCAAIPHDLLESELFGYEAGAFTGATKSKPGKFELAHTGTLFLDEIAEMSPQLQAKLLHVLQDGEFARLGAKHDVKVDVRLLCATNKLLEQRVADGLFREDLFYRINVVSIHIPPLRERRDEILPLMRLFLAKYAAQYSKPPAAFSAEAEQAMLRHAWPGNIRELENLCKRFVIVGGETQILREMAAHLAEVPASPTPAAIVVSSNEPIFAIGKRASLEAEAVAIRRTLEETHWNRKEAARRLQMSYKSLLNRLKVLEATGQMG